MLLMKLQRIMKDCPDDMRVIVSSGRAAGFGKTKLGPMRVHCMDTFGDPDDHYSYERWAMSICAKVGINIIYVFEMNQDDDITVGEWKHFLKKFHCSGFLSVMTGGRLETRSPLPAKAEIQHREGKDPVLVIRPVYR